MSASSEIVYPIPKSIKVKNILSEDELCVGGGCHPRRDDAFHGEHGSIEHCYPGPTLDTSMSQAIIWCHNILKAF